MKAQTRRSARFSHDYAMLMAMILIVCIAVVRVLTPEQVADPRPLWERIASSLLGLAQCFLLVVGAAALIALLEFLKQRAAHYQRRRQEAHRARLEPLLRDAAVAGSSELTQAIRFLSDSNEIIRRHAFAVAFTILRRNPNLASTATGHALEKALLEEPGFARTLASTPPDQSLLQRVTLGAKLGAGSADKRLASPTSDPDELARWIETHRREQDNPEIQVSIGYDTGSLPYLSERSRFIALALFIATTDLSRFQALVRRPPRDPNAAYGLVIRGDVVEVRYPGQARGHRLDYVFPLPTRLDTERLARLIRDIQLVNLGLLIGCAEDTARVLLPGQTPDWLDATRRTIAGVYRLFERRLVSLLRQYDRLREPRSIHLLVSIDHQERVRAFREYRLEECLYPQFGWVVPLYEPDTRWDRLLDPLRGIEGMLLHQGAGEDGETTRGAEFVRAVRQLGHETARKIEQALAGEPSAIPSIPPEPFLDGSEEEAVTHYLSRVARAMAQKEAYPEDVADPKKFRLAADYYGVALTLPENPNFMMPREAQS